MAPSIWKNQIVIYWFEAVFNRPLSKRPYQGPSIAGCYRFAPNRSISTPYRVISSCLCHLLYFGLRALYSIFIHTINFFGNLSSVAAVNFGLSMLSLIYAIAVGLGQSGARCPMSGVLCPVAAGK